MLTAAVAATIAGATPPPAWIAPGHTGPAPMTALRLVPLAGFDADTAVSGQGVPPAPLPAAPLPASQARADAAPAPATAPATAATPPEIVVSGEHKMEKIDPLAGVNKTTFAALESVDKALVGPIAHGYRDGVPGPIRQGLHNFFFNLTEPVNALNHVLQLHPGRAFKTMARFGINSTAGIGGLLDVAKKKPFNIHYRPNGFGNTFGYWGIGPGPFLFLPLVGPTSLRDLIGSLLDQAALPLVFKPLKNYYYVTAAGLITELDYRVDIDEGVERVRKTSSPYASYRQLYFKSRFDQIEGLHGRGPLARGEVGQPPFVTPLYPDADPAQIAPPTLAPPAGTPPAGAGPSMPVAADPGPPVPPAPAAPLPPVFVSHPVVQPLPAGN